MDFARLLGLLLMLAAFLMLTFTPQLLFESWHRDGYERTEVQVLTGPGRSRTIRVRVISTGEEIGVRRTSLDGTYENRRIPVWYNPEAIAFAGITLFDTRIVSMERWPEFPQFSDALLAALLNLALAAGGVFLLFGSRARPRGKVSTNRRSGR